MDALEEKQANEADLKDKEDDDEDGYTYEEELELDSDTEIEDPHSEDLDTTLQSLQKLSYMLGKDKPRGGQDDSRKAEVIDDFVRNFLVRMSLTKTLSVFETEWFEIREKRMVFESHLPYVPDEYTRAMQKEEILCNLQQQLKQANYLAQCRQEMLEKFRKERNVHRMHHRRIVQEKNKLIADIKLSVLTLHGPESEVSSVTTSKGLSNEKEKKTAKSMERKDSHSPFPALINTSNAKSETLAVPRVMNMPVKVEPTLVKDFTLQKTFRGHPMPISNVVLHPKKAVAATASDDKTWQMWDLPGGDLIMTGDGHKSWVAGLDFHPSGMQLASSSGDCTVKIWDFEQACCVHTFSDHTQAVWSVAYHGSGDVLASSSMDHTARIWDVISMKCRGTLRGHVDSVNGVTWQPYSSYLCTASSDKTVSLWDARSSVCVQTFYGHQSSCNHATFDPRGTTIASADANGIVKIWDIRKIAEYATIDMGPNSANKCAFDGSGYVIAIASNDCTIKCFQIYGEVLPVKELQGHTGPVLAIVFERAGRFAVSGGSDCTFRIWA